MIEITNTSKFDVIPEGRYTLRVMGRPLKYETEGGHTYRKWKFGILENNTIVKKFTCLFYAWESDFLTALGGVKEKGGITWDDETVDGRAMEVDLVHVRYKKKGDEEERIKYAFRNYEETIPF